MFAKDYVCPGCCITHKEKGFCLRCRLCIMYGPETGAALHAQYIEQLGQKVKADYDRLTAMGVI